MTSRVALVVVMTAACWRSLAATAGPASRPQPIFKSRTDLMQVDAVVIDAQGRPITGLKKSDFMLMDRNTQQVIDAFEEVSHSPVTAPLFPADAEDGRGRQRLGVVHASGRDRPRRSARARQDARQSGTWLAAWSNRSALRLPLRL